MNFAKIIVILIVLAGVGVYAVMEYPQYKDDLGNIFKSPAFEFSFPKPVSTSSKKTTISSSPKPTQQVTETATTTYLPHIKDSQIPSGFTRNQLSPYFEKIQISSFSYSSSVSTPSKISLSSFLSSKDSAVNITGWKIKSNNGEMTIPQAIETYYPDGSSKSGDIYFSASHYLNLYTNKSAIGANLRINKCLGYLEDTYNFNPALSKSCPRVYDSKSEIADLSGDCQTYIMSLSSCEIPPSDEYNSFSGDTGNACRAYLSKISYGTCFNKHRSDSNFLSNEWRVWLDQANILDQQHDRLRLYDKDGLLVDEYVY